MSLQLIVSMLTRLLTEKTQSVDFLNEFRQPNCFIRNRMLSMSQVVKFLFFKNDSTIASRLHHVRGFLMDRAGNCEFPLVTSQAISKARGGILPELFRILFDKWVSLYYKLNTCVKLWKGKYRPFAIDGTELDIPSHKSTHEEFGVHSDPKNPNYKWSQGLGSVMYDVLQDIIIDAVLGKDGANERDLAMQHISRAKDLGIFAQNNVVILFDRGYYSAEMYWECVQADCKCLMRLKKSSGFCKLELDDDIVEISAPDGTVMTARVLKTLLSTGETEYLITNIMDDDLTCDDFRELYFDRWQIEQKYREAKEFWKIEEFSGHTVYAVRQDFYINMILINMTSIVKAMTDQLISEKSRSSNKYKYQARRTYLIGRMAGCICRWLFVSTDEMLRDLENLIREASHEKSQIKDGRSFSRKKKNRARKQYNNKKSAI